MTESDTSREAALFLHLVLSLQQSAMIGLGKLMNPMSGKIERNLENAKSTIDMLSSLAARTRGNLDANEERALTQVLTDLRMNYVDEVKKGA